MGTTTTTTAEVTVTGPSGDMDRLEELFRAEHPTAVRLAYLLTGDAEVAEDLAQEAFVRIAHRLADADNPGAYLRTAVVNLCRDHGRRRVVARRHPGAPARATDAPALPSDLGEVWRAMDALPEHQRTVLVLRFWLDLPTAEIARLIDVPHPTVRSRIRRGLASIKEVLSDDR